jgi:hypothetical protein
MPARATLNPMNAPSANSGHRNSSSPGPRPTTSATSSTASRPIAMTGGTAGHGRIIRNVNFALRPGLRGGPCEPLGPDAGVEPSARPSAILTPWSPAPSSRTRIAPSVALSWFSKCATPPQPTTRTLTSEEIRRRRHKGRRAMSKQGQGLLSVVAALLGLRFMLRSSESLPGDVLVVASKKS